MRQRSPFGWIYHIVVILGFLVIMVGVGEWLIWVNVDRYPHWLTHEYVVNGSTETSEDLIQLMPAFEKLCNKPGGFAVITKANARCYPSSSRSQSASSSCSGLQG